jgi:hypothetical protein
VFSYLQTAFLMTLSMHVCPFRASTAVIQVRSDHSIISVTAFAALKRDESSSDLENFITPKCAHWREAIHKGSNDGQVAVGRALLQVEERSHGLCQ